MEVQVLIDISTGVFVFEGGVELDFLFDSGNEFSCCTDLRPANPSH